ncbi:MAG TPA: UMP kinase [Candidatus Deferrimicrobium sp.]|nr:UMP kinase [Candidatus Deferrimicrobium sp.]
MKIVIKIGGSLIIDKDGQINVSEIKQIAKNIEILLKEGHDIVIIVGGGVEARKYISAMRALGASEGYCDEIGIRVSRVNARLFISALKGLVHPIPPRTLEETLQAVSTRRAVVLGGLQPGQSTNGVAALVAELVGANILINVTDVDGIYSADPRNNAKAEKFDEVSVNQLFELINQPASSLAGTYRLFDILALKIIDRSKIYTHFISGKQPENIVRVVRGEKIGTRIIF